MFTYTARRCTNDSIRDMTAGDLCGWAAAYNTVLFFVGVFYIEMSETVANRKRIHDQIDEDFVLVTRYVVLQPRGKRLVGRQLLL